MTNPIAKNLYRDIVETIRNTLDIKIVKQKIVEAIGKALSTDRCFILEYDKTKDEFLKVSEEYLSSSNMPSYIGIDLNENIPKFASEFKKGKTLLLNQTKALLDGQEFDINNGSFESEKNAIEYYKVYSALVFPIYYQSDFFGDLILHYVDGTHEAGEDEINLLKDIADQISMAIHQANLYKLVKENAKRETILRKLIEAIRTTINLDKTKQIIVKTIGETLKADRCFITDYDNNTGRFLPIKDEYLSSKEVISVKGQDVHEIVPDFIDAVKNGKYLLVKNKEIFLEAEKQNFEIEQNTFTKYGVNSTFAVPLTHKENFLGVLSVHYTDEMHEIGDFEINLIKDVASQVAIAIYQANLYESVHKYAERGKLLREITEKIRSSLDINETLDFICEETAKLFNVQRVTIVNFYDSQNYENYSIKREYKINPNLKGLSSSEYSTKAGAYWNKTTFETRKILAFNDVQKSDAPDYFKECYAAIGVKSIIGVPIKQESTQWGTLVLSEYNNYREWSNEEKDLLSIVANQVYIAIHQAELYEAQKKMTEREIISKNIIEILRSSIDKTVIKKLFVKNIGKFFNANRVFFAEYDDNEKKLMPVEKDSEYLSSPEEKSVICVDWSQNFIKDYYQAVQEKREVKIFSMDEYIKDKDLKGDIKDFLESAEIKSSYSFPVFYQDKILGSFCLDFTQQNTKLSDEDISRIRNMCIQAGIALYHAEMLSKAQTLATLKSSCIKNMTNAINELTDNLKKLSDEISKAEQKCDNCNLYLNYLNEVVTRISDFVKSVQNEANRDKD